jgi:hypothetical protein
MIRNADYRPGSGLSAAHPFRFAKVIDMYHADVSYIGSLSPDGRYDYTPHRFNFLCVRWYKTIPAESPFHLDEVQLCDLAEDDAIGFVDPGDVLRLCHIPPRFSSGKVHPGGKGLSKFAADKHDWNSYYVNQ